MVTSFQFLANSLFAVVCAVMGISFLSLNTPNTLGLNNYRISLKVLAASYLTLSVLTIAVLVFNIKDNSQQYFSFFTLSVSSIQASLFSFTLIVLLNPGFFKTGNIIRLILPYLILSLLYLLSFSLYGDPKIESLMQISQSLQNPTLWIRLIFLGYYFFQLVYYTYLFFKEARRYDQGLLNYFSEVVKLRLNWVRVAFVSALLMGITALVSGFVPLRFDWLFTLLFTAFYFAFAQEYIKYNKVYTIVEPAIISPQGENGSSSLRHLIKTDWANYKKEITVQKYYCKSGVNIEELAKKLNIGRTTLSNLINREEGMNFNSWINRLRIEDAKQLLIDHPDYPIAVVSELVGYTEQANFSRQFKQITGESPLYWRKKAVS